jgi:hypothetical protein
MSQDQARRSTREGKGQREEIALEIVDVPEVKAVRYGTGVPLQSLPAVVEYVRAQDASGDLLTQAHLLIYGNKGSSRGRKPAILDWSGHPDADKPGVSDRLKARVAKLTLPMIKGLMDVFDIERSAQSFKGGKASKDSMASRLTSWILEPKASGRKGKRLSGMRAGKTAVGAPTKGVGVGKKRKASDARAVEPRTKAPAVADTCAPLNGEQTAMLPDIVRIVRSADTSSFKLKDLLAELKEAHGDEVVSVAKSWVKSVVAALLQ